MEGGIEVPRSMQLNTQFEVTGPFSTRQNNDTIEISLNDGYTLTRIRSALLETMPDIFHDFPIEVSPDRVFEAISTPRGLDAWWTKKSSGRPAEGGEYELWFGPQYDWVRG
jgi:hypothetical protein